MLDSRYVYLHQALGLGPMWLNQKAKLSKSLHHNNGNNIMMSSCSSRKISLPKEKKITVNIHDTPQAASNLPSNVSNMLPARFETLRRVGSSRIASQTVMVKNTPSEVKKIMTVSDYLNNLQGSIPYKRIMVLSLCASPAGVIAGKLLSGDEDALYEKMLQAIDLKKEDVYLSTWLKDLPDFNPNPAKEMIKLAAARVEAECILSQCQALLLMGKFFDDPEVLDIIKQFKNTPTIFKIPHPRQILDNSELKRYAWESLQHLRDYLSE